MQKKTKKILALILALITVSTTAISVMAEDPCTHENTSTETINATCTEDGSTVITCDDCDETISTTPIAATGHTWGEWDETPATCTADGSKTRECTADGCDGTETETIPATGHTVSDWETTTPAGCTTEGEKTGTCTCGETVTEAIEATGHTYGEWTVEEAATCTEDGVEKRVCTVENCEGFETRPIEATGHSGGTATCTEKAVCDECGESYGEYSHTFGEWETVTPATCTEDGTKVRYCTGEDCDASEDGVIEALGHNFTGDYVLGDVVNEGEETIHVHGRKCVNEGCEEVSEAELCDTTDGNCVCGREQVTEEPETPDVPDDDDNDDNGNSSSSSSGSSSSSDKNETVDVKTESIKDITNARKGDNVYVDLPTGTNTIPADYLAATKTKDVSIIVDYGNGYKWVISDIESTKGVDLSIDKDASYLVEQGKLNSLKGDNSNVIDIKHDGELGFKAVLKYDVKQENAGKYVNLYFYDPVTKELKFEGTSQVKIDGTVNLTFTHCSTYVLNITDEPVDLSAGEQAEIVTEALPVTQEFASVATTAATESAENPKTGTSSMALLAIPAALASAATLFRKKK